jgi:hypothetical protein
LFRTFGLPVCVLLFILLAGFFAITRGQADGSDIPPPQPVPELDPAPVSDSATDGTSTDGTSDGAAPPDWIPPGPPRWFRSNAGGMALEEIPSRRAALRNKYALVIDYRSPEELPELLLPFYRNGYTVEIRLLFEQGNETRRQWLFRDEAGAARLVAVFERADDEAAPPVESGGEAGEPPADAAVSEAPPDSAGPDAAVSGITPDNAASDVPSADAPPGGDTPSDASTVAAATAESAAIEDSAAASDVPSADAPSPDVPSDAALVETVPAKSAFRGFIELYDEQSYITGEYQFSGADGETKTEYFYRRNTMIRAEARRKFITGETEEYQKVYTDHYRYNRSGSLRSAERVYHAEAQAEPVRLTFPNRVLDAAADDSFLRDKVPPGSDFFGDTWVEEGYRMVFTTDDRGRVLTQTLLDAEDNPVWIIENTWEGDRIIAMQKTEGEVTLLVEFEYDSKGNRIVERNLRGGVLERLVRTDGDRDTEELYMNDVVILRALWENGRKIAEERIRNR